MIATQKQSLRPPGAESAWEFHTAGPKSFEVYRLEAKAASKTGWYYREFNPSGRQSSMQSYGPYQWRNDAIVIGRDHFTTRRGSIPLPLLAFQAAAGIGIASGVAAVVRWAQAAIGGAL